jgi:hypothetical protein
MARKGLGGLLGTISKVYRSSITAAFRPRLAINNNH